MNHCDITLYGILDPDRSAGRPLPQLALDAVRGGVTLLQYRDKNSGVQEMIDQSRAIIIAIAGSGVPLLINDRVDVALAVEADGVHLGQDDMKPEDARNILGPEAIIGQTIKCQNDAFNAPVELIDYVCIGGVFDTLSKDNPSSIGLKGWQENAAFFRENHPKLPVGAIAGIDHGNAGEVIRAGADGVAIISALFMADDVTASARTLRQQISLARGA